MLQTSIRLDTLGEQNDPLGIVKETELWPYNKWYMHNSTSVVENDT